MIGDLPIHLDNATSVGRRPAEVGEAMLAALDLAPSTPGRARHRLALAAERLVERTREGLAQLCGVRAPQRVAFTHGATEALNLAVGSLEAGATVLLSCYEHDALLRPLSRRAQRGELALEDLAPPAQGLVDVTALHARLARGGVQLVATTAASNVTGQSSDLRGIAAVCRAYRVPLLVDATQAVGILELDVDGDDLAFVALGGQRGLLGPPGTGALCLGPGRCVEPLLCGATSAQLDGPSMPSYLPACLEAGSSNVPALAGLGAGIGYIRQIGLDVVRSRHEALRKRLCEQLATISGVRLLGAHDGGRPALAIVSLTIEGWSPRELELELDRRGVCARSGLCNAGRAHRTLGTAAQGGALRLSASLLTHESEIDQACLALREIVQVPTRPLDIHAEPMPAGHA